MQPDHESRSFWRTSCPAGACLGVAFPEGAVVLSEITDGQPVGPRIALTHDEWTAFLSGAKAGEFDPPDA